MHLTHFAELFLERLRLSKPCARSGVSLPVGAAGYLLIGSSQHLVSHVDSGPVASLPPLWAASLVWLREDRKVRAAADWDGAQHLSRQQMAALWLGPQHRSYWLGCQEMHDVKFKLTRQIHMHFPFTRACWWLCYRQSISLKSNK